MQETQETRVRSLGRDDPLEKKMATHSSILAQEFHGQRSLAGYSPWGWKALALTGHVRTYITQSSANHIYRDIQHTLMLVTGILYLLTAFTQFSSFISHLCWPRAQSLFLWVCPFLKYNWPINTMLVFGTQHSDLVFLYISKWSPPYYLRKLFIHLAYLYFLFSFLCLIA